MKTSLIVAGVALAVGILLLAGCNNETPSEPMNETGPATKLGFGSVPSALVAGTPFTLTVRALREDNSVDNNFSGSISIAKSSGPGTLSGTLSRSASAGVATFANLIVDIPGDYAFNASSANLTQTVTSPITAQPAATVTKMGTFSGQNGYSTTGTVEVIRKVDGSEDLKTGSDFTVNGGAGSIGVWLTNSTGAANLNNTSQKVQVGLITSGFSGVYEYSIPGGLGTFTHVVTFCEGAQVNFGNAELMDP